MTDLDVVCRRAATGWVGVAHALRDRAEPDISGRAIERALARHLRDNGGLGDPVLTGLLVLYGADSPPIHGDLRRGLVRQVRERVADRVLPGLVAAGSFESRGDAEAYLVRSLRMASLDRLAEVLMRSPAGRGVRASRRQKASLSSLLAEAAPLGVRA